MSDFDYTGRLLTASVLLGSTQFTSETITLSTDEQDIVFLYFDAGYEGNSRYLEYDLNRWTLSSNKCSYTWKIKGNGQAWTTLVSGTQDSTTVGARYIINTGVSTSLIKIPAQIKLSLSSTIAEDATVILYSTNYLALRMVGYTSST